MALYRPTNPAYPAFMDCYPKLFPCKNHVNFKPRPKVKVIMFSTLVHDVVQCFMLCNFGHIVRKLWKSNLNSQCLIVTPARGRTFTSWTIARNIVVNHKLSAFVFPCDCAVKGRGGAYHCKWKFLGLPLWLCSVLDTGLYLESRRIVLNVTSYWSWW